MTRPPNTAPQQLRDADSPPLSEEVLELIDHIAEILAEEFAAAMKPDKEMNDARSSLR